MFQSDQSPDCLYWFCPEFSIDFVLNNRPQTLSVKRDTLITRLLSDSFRAS